MMECILKRARRALNDKLIAANIDFNTRVDIKTLTPQEAVGVESSPELAINRGPERVIEAEIEGTKGQAFTDVPVDWSGSLQELFELDLVEVHNRAHVVALLNAACKLLHVCDGVIHCIDEDPERCGDEFVDKIEKEYDKPVIAIFGLQPFIAQALAKRFGKERIIIADLNPNNVGDYKQGMLVMHGQKDADELIDKCTVGLITGSSLVNNTLDDTLKKFEEKQKPYILFGNTISGTAALLGLNHFCPFAL